MAQASPGVGTSSCDTASRSPATATCAPVAVPTGGIVRSLMGGRVGGREGGRVFAAAAATCMCRADSAELLPSLCCKQRLISN